jgi:WD40 repeat protein
MARGGKQPPKAKAANPSSCKMPLATFQSGVPICSFFSGHSSLFIGLESGFIEEWEPQRFKRNYTGNARWLLQCGNMLWSTDEQHNIQIWDIATGECIKKMYTHYAGTMIEWKGTIYIKDDYNGFTSWTTNGNLLRENIRLDFNGNLISMTTWNKLLCCGHQNGTIALWNDVDDLFRSWKGHHGGIQVLTVANNALFSGGQGSWGIKGLIKKWNHAGECLMYVRVPEAILCMEFHDNYLVCGCSDRILLWISMEGEIIKRLGTVEDPVSITVWKGALFTRDKHTIYQVTPFSEWKPKNHKCFSSQIRKGIKAMILSSGSFVPMLPQEILFMIFQFYASHAVLIEGKAKKAKVSHKQDMEYQKLLWKFIQNENSEQQ